MTYKSVLLFVFDGLRADAFDRALTSGRMPFLTRGLDSSWTRRPLLAALPSAGPVAHLPAVTGHFPGSLDLPGSAFFAPPKSDLLKGYGERPLRTEPLSLGEWLPSDKRLLEEIIPEGQSLKSPVPRVPVKVPLWKKILGLSTSASWPRTLQETRLLLQQVRTGFAPPLMIVHLEAPGWLARNISPQAEELLEFLSEVDTYLDEVHQNLTQSGQVDETAMLIVAPFSWGDCVQRKPLEELLHDAGFALAATAGKSAIPALCAAVSGTSLAHLCLPDELGRRQALTSEEVLNLCGTAFENLRAAAEVDHLITWDKEGQPVIHGASGTARLVQDGNAYRYTVEGDDPLHRASKRIEVPLKELLEPSPDDLYPDAFLQLLQLGQSARRGDILLMSKPTVSLIESPDQPKSNATGGTLHRDHALGTLLASFPVREGTLRSADVAPTVLELLGRPLEGQVDGRTFVRKA